jgi:hypothetical protein
MTTMAGCPGALHTETVLSPSSKYLALGLTGAMGRFFADLDASVRMVGPIQEVWNNFRRSWRATM